LSKGTYSESLEKNHTWNVIMNILDGSFFSIAIVCFTPAIIIISYLEHYTKSTLILNLPVFIANFALAIGPFIMSFFSGRFERKKKAMVIAGLTQRLLWLPVVAVVFFSYSLGKNILPVFLIIYTFYYVVWGLGTIFWQEMIGRSFVGNRIGSAMGIREFISKILGFFASIAVMYILSSIAFPTNFLVLFFIAFICMMISMSALSMLREAPYEGKTESHPPLMHLKNMFMLPKIDKKFKLYVLFIIFGYGNLFIGGLYTIIGLKNFGASLGPGSLTGIISVISALAAAIFALMVGKIYEKFGKFSGFFSLSLISTILPIAIIFCNNYYFYLVIIFFSAAVNCMWFIELATIMDFATPEKRHQYIGFISIVKLLLIIVYTNVGGLLADYISPNAAFLMSSLFCLIGLYILVFKLRPIWKTE